MFNAKIRSIVAISLAMLSVSAAAQTLPDDVRTAVRLSPEQRAAVGSFADAHSRALASGDPVAVGQARAALVAPLESAPPPSVAFRLALNEALLPSLRPIISGDDEHASFNAIRIAGAIAVEESARAVADALTDPRPSVRYAAAFALRGLLQDVAAGRSPIPPERVIDAIAAALRTESDRGAIEGYVAALTVGQDAAPAAQPIRKLSAALSEQIIANAASVSAAAAATGWAQTYFRALRAVQTAALAQLRQGRIDPAFAVPAAEFAGHTVAHAVRRVAVLDRGALAQQEWEALAQLVGAAEVTLSLIHSNLVPTDEVTGSPLKDAFDAERNGAPEALAKAAQAWIGPQGRLASQPYSIPADRFAVR